MSWIPRDLWLRRALVAWAILAAAASVKLVVQGDQHAVYPVFAAAARHWWSDEPIHGAYAGLDYYVYSPTLAIALTPFGLLPNRIGGVLWNLTSIGLLVWSLRLLVRDVLPGRWPPGREALFLGLVLVGSIRGVWSAHSNAILLACVLFGLSAVMRQRWWAAAALLAVPVFIKIWPLALALLVIAVRPRPLALRFAACLAVLAAVPFLTRPPDVVCRQYQGWYERVQSMSAERRSTIRDFWSIADSLTTADPRTLEVDRQMGLGERRAHTIVQLVTAAAVLGWCLWQARRTSDPRLLLTLILAIWTSWQLLFGPGSERLTYILAAPVASWALLVSFQQRRLRVLAVAATALIVLIGTGGGERLLLPHWSGARMLLPLGAAVLLVWTVLYAWFPSPAERERG